jgi:hypothetical protein
MASSPRQACRAFFTATRTRWFSRLIFSSPTAGRIRRDHHYYRFEFAAEAISNSLKDSSLKGDVRTAGV